MTKTTVTNKHIQINRIHVHFFSLISVIIYQANKLSLSILVDFFSCLCVCVCGNDFDHNDDDDDDDHNDG